MARAPKEYVDDVSYVRHFIGDLAPSRLRLVAALNGLAPPPAEDFDYCELGCAHGDTLVALAAAHPDSRFLGVDLLPDHVASAKKLAKDGALENVGVLERDFAALLSEDLGPFDYMVAHGVLSWIGPEKRKALVDFASAKLKPGGLLFVSYNAMPGWSAVEPLRQMLLYGGEGGRTSLERAEKGLAFAQAMRSAGAVYFQTNPAASDMLDTMARAGLPYIVHEYLHEHWSPMYFARVAWEMSQNDLHFAGVLPLHANFRDTALTEPQLGALGGVTDRIAFESLRDFATNEFFRRDVFVKGRAPRTEDTTHTYLSSTAFGLLGPVPKSVKLPHREVAMDGDEIEKVVDALTFGAQVLAPEHAAAARKLLVTEQIVPMSRPTLAVKDLAADARFEVPLPYNQRMLRGTGADAPLLLVSPLTGTAYPMSALEALAIRALVEHGAEREQWIRDHVGRSVLRIRIGDRVIEDRDEQARTILAAVDDLRTNRLAKLIELGVISFA